MTTMQLFIKLMAPEEVGVLLSLTRASAEQALPCECEVVLLLRPVDATRHDRRSTGG